MNDTPNTTRQQILHELKLQGSATQSTLAASLALTREAVRQQLAQLEQQGFVRSEAQSTPGRGRPTHVYRLTAEAESLFPKFHDALTLTLIDALDDTFGEAGLQTVLSHITDRQVALWNPRMQGKELRERMKALRGLYFDTDPYTEVREDDQGPMLIEHNCPYLSAAQNEPRLCSVTLSTMKRLLGVEVERTQRFQQGDGRCVFRIHEDKPVAAEFRFALESRDKNSEKN